MEGRGEVRRRGEMVYRGGERCGGKGRGVEGNIEEEKFEECSYVQGQSE